jgi:hypothetical protein
MQPFLAESVPHRRRTFAFIAALAVVGLLAVLSHHGRTKHRYHQKTRCSCHHTSYVLVVR